ncbi:sulfotransferase [Agarivorans sp. TSD2052]|uniref:sulfotransferase n=1 Tax=Agarivorans sp. TSD2052 TaxID=2937286 RepID=UPI00200BE692|nr:sulfotransferase [Agarivorans sp. TSD2052]UPW20061.1 sulfotransferase [Agarivorans sp. TSD2052]
MSNNFNKFKQQIDQALALVESAAGVDIPQLPQEANEQFVDTQSLLERCELVCKQHEDKKPTIRIIHHLACSGGTLISKCISAMPNVYLLSEVHPFTELAVGTGQPKYAPSDIISLSKYAGIPKQKKLAAKLFKSAISEVYSHVESMGGVLVLRDHTHADFTTNEPIPEKSALLALLEDDYQIKSVLTLRNPIDSYASLVKNGWVHFEPKSFDEYCRRLLLLLEQFEPEKIFKYEDFLNEPQEQMQAIANVLNLPFDESFEDVFSMFKVTGDSGRSSAVIGSRESLAGDSLMAEAKESLYYNKFLIKIGKCNENIDRNTII